MHRLEQKGALVVDEAGGEGGGREKDGCAGRNKLLDDVVRFQGQVGEHAPIVK